MDILSFELGRKLGGGGQPSPTPSSGYVEDKLMYYYEGNEGAFYQVSKQAEELPYTSTSKQYSIALTPRNGLTMEAYILMSGASTASSYSRGFALGDTAFCIGFGNGGGSSGSNYRYNPMIYWGASIDYDIYPAGLYYGDKHTFAIVSTPNENSENNTLKFYLDGTQIGDEKTHSGTAINNNTFFTIEGGTSRPLNGKLFNGRFYTRALTAAELASNHANDVAKYGGND